MRITALGWFLVAWFLLGCSCVFCWVASLSISVCRLVVLLEWLSVSSCVRCVWCVSGVCVCFSVGW